MPRDVRRSECLTSSMIPIMNDGFARLTDIWDEVGIKEEMRWSRAEVVKKHMQELLNEMVDEEIKMRDRLKKNIECSLKELRILSHELSLEACTVDKGMTILQIERELRVKLEIMTQEKNERLEELRVLQQKDQELCSDLCATPYYIPSGSVPSWKQLEELKEHIKARSEEKKERLHVFSSLREEIRLCLDEMGRQPETSLEHDAICEDEEAFFLTVDNIKALKVLKQQLELKKECLISTLNTIKERVQVLWHRLQVPQEEQDLYLKAAKCPINEDINKWENELIRLEELKKSNLKMVILKAREEIQLYWDKCCVSAEQRNAFAPYWSDDYTEDMLSQHDEEVVRIKLHYEKSKEMLDAVNKWETSWEKFIVLEKRASDPNRFSNRGGTLLKEEKERAKVQKMLKKLEEELKTRVEAWEAEQGCEFLLKGNRFMDYISSQWEVLKREKEREKQERNLKKDENSTPFKTPVKRPAGSCMQNTPSSKNRKLNGANAIMSRTVSVNNVASASQTINVKTPLPTIKTPLKTKDTPVRTPLQDSNKKTSMFSNQPGSYSEFKEEIAKKSNSEAIFNSTVNENL